ncbi:MAG TPA: penicillin-binding protein 1C [Longimicrobiales bacterium]
MKRRLVFACLLGAAPLAAAAAWIAWPLPESITRPQPVASVTLLDRNGLPLRTTRSAQGTRGGWIAIDDVDPDIIRAFVAAEDQRFYVHHGVDARALARALRDVVRARRITSGASTITMQTARLLRGTKRSWLGKAQQLFWAARIDAHLGKNAVLERYLNRVPLGQGTVGVPAAASLYFEAAASNLSIGQAALLAAFARSPARDNAVTAPDRARARRHVVLERMQRLGYISGGEAERANAEPIEIPNAAARFLAPHFTTRVLQQIAARSAGPVRTSLDLSLQSAIESEVRHTVATLHDRAAAQAAAVVLDNRTGDVLAWVGSPDFFSSAAGQVDMVVSARQPGSALKPFLYGAAFDRGFTAATVLPDVPRVYATAGGPYQPQNYDRRFHGPVRARVALASSFNVPAVELADRIGTGTLLRTLQAAGFASLARSPEHYGLGLALGNGDVTLLELANAYRGIALGGVWQPVRMFDERTTAAEDERARARRRFMTTSSAALVLDILSDPVARVGGFGMDTPLEFAFRAAAKTGTSRHYTDNWAVATTAYFTVAVWVGNFSGRPMQAVSGITGAGPLLHRAVLEVARRYRPGRLMDPERAGLVAEPICILSGMRATPACPSMIEWFAPGTEPALADTWQSSGRVALPAEYAEWSAVNEQLSAITIAPPDQASRITGRILSPLDGDRYQRPPGVDGRYVTIPLVADGANSSVQWFVDERRLARPRWQTEKGAHVIRASWPNGASDSVHIVVE